METLRFGIDLGGSKTEIIALDLLGQTLLQRRIPTPREDYAATLNCIATLVREAEAELGCMGTLGIGIPGAESRSSGLIKNANSTWLIGKPLRRDLENLLQREVRLANDANCFALSEATDGAAVGAEVVFGVILGTGVGGGIVVSGRVLQGANSIAGEWGHCYLPPIPFSFGVTPASQALACTETSHSSFSTERCDGGSQAASAPNHGLPPLGVARCVAKTVSPAASKEEPRCYCGRSGCVETYLSGPGLSNDHQRMSGHKLSAEEIATRAVAGDLTCEASLQRYEDRLAFALAQVINVLDPDVIVLGGGLSNLDRLYSNVPKLWKQHIFSNEVNNRLVKNVHGDSSGVRGAAWLWPSAD